VHQIVADQFAVDVFVLEQAYHLFVVVHEFESIFYDLLLPLHTLCQ
jgi:hypothetical protein